MKTVVVLVLGIVLATAVSAGASRERAAGALQFSGANLKGPFTGVDCPPGTPDGSLCWTIAHSATVPGLGAVSQSGEQVIDAAHTSCEVWHSTSVLTVVGKGTIDLAIHTPSGGCINGTGGTPVHAAEDFTVTGGTGAYAGASGSGTAVTFGPGLPGDGFDQLTGTLDAPATTFDVTPPTISGATAKTVRAPKGKRAVRVQYAVRAQDAVDGSVAVTCKPASGSSFRLGRTPVTCTSTDSSANTATAGFTVTVRR